MAGRRHPDEEPGLRHRTARRVEEVRQSPADRLARGMFGGHVEVAISPRPTDRPEGREDHGIHGQLEPLASEGLVEDPLQAVDIQPARQPRRRC